jgi:hypothetical protein
VICCVCCARAPAHLQRALGEMADTKVVPTHRLRGRCAEAPRPPRIHHPRRGWIKESAPIQQPPDLSQKPPRPLPRPQAPDFNATVFKATGVKAQAPRPQVSRGSFRGFRLQGHRLQGHASRTGFRGFTLQCRRLQGQVSEASGFKATGFKDRLQKLQASPRR